MILSLGVRRKYLVLIAVVFVVGAVALRACQAPWHVLSTSIAPDHRKIAYVMKADDMPLVGTDMVVAIKPADRDLDLNADVVFRGEDMDGRGFGPINIRWLPDGSLWVGYCSGRTSIYHNSWWDVRAKDPQEIAVVLEREPVGHWPANGPPNGQSGPPPCM